MGTLWICVTGIAGMLLAQFDDPARYVRLALRLTGPPILLLLCEESVRTAGEPGSRKTSIGFALLIWAAAVGALIYFRGAPLGEFRLSFLDDLQMGVTVWMAMLGVCFLAAVLTVLPALFKRVSPGLGGLAALLLLGSETWAAVDPRWSTGALSFGAIFSYRSLLTFGLAVVALVKAHRPGFLLSAAAVDPAPSSKGDSRGRDDDEKKQKKGERKSVEKKEEPRKSSAGSTNPPPKRKKKGKKK